MNDIYMESPSQDYYDIWSAAGRHLHSISQGAINWIKSEPNPPFLEHLSFRLGNRIFFLRFEDVDECAQLPGNPDGLLTIAEGYKSKACLLPMKKNGTEWTPVFPGWGLVDAVTRAPFNPVDLVTDENIEMTDWELQDFAVQVVRNSLAQEGYEIMTYNSRPGVFPSIWFIRDEIPEWVVVTYALYPVMKTNGADIVSDVYESINTGASGNLAEVFISSSEELKNITNVPIPPYRGHGLSVNFKGLTSY